MCISCKINNIAEYNNFSNNGDTEIGFRWREGLDVGEHNGVGFVEIF